MKQLLAFLREPQPDPDTEHRTYTNLISAARAEAALGTSKRKLLAILEACTGLYARAFAQATIQGPAELSPSVLANVARLLISRGECILDIATGYTAAATWDIEGGVDRRNWTYRLDLPSPSAYRSAKRSAAAVLHFQFAYNPETPWIGLSPLALSDDTVAVFQALEGAIGDESEVPNGYLLTVPQGVSEDALAQLKLDLAALRGRVALVETTAGGWGEGRSASPTKDWQPNRLGPEFSPAYSGLRRDLERSIITACGVPIELLFTAEGSSAREAWRRFLHGSVQPLGKIVEAELQSKLSTSISISFDSLMASDIQGRARAYQSLVGGGMEPTTAARLVGMTDEGE